MGEVGLFRRLKKIFVIVLLNKPLIHLFVMSLQLIRNHKLIENRHRITFSMDEEQIMFIYFFNTYTYIKMAEYQCMCPLNFIKRLY